MIINVWIALRDDAQALIRERLDTPDEDYTGPVDDRTARLFRRMVDRNTVQRLFKVARVGGRDYTLWSIYFNEKRNVLQKIKDEVDRLAVKYPNRFIVAGAWHFDGRQIADYPPDPRLDRFMPDGVVKDINILFGQSPRDFS